MKLNKYISLAALSLALLTGCEKGLDPINPQGPGTDETAPVITITAPDPESSKPVQSTDELATYVFKGIIEDDIELKSVKLTLDGTVLTTFTSFKDYRRLLLNYTYNGLVDGDHVFEVVAVDMLDKTTTTTVNFKKVTVPPYDPLPNEVAYFRFDDDLMNIISGTDAAKQGGPSFAEGKSGSAYAGAADSYLTYPSETLTGNEFSVAFWYKINAVPDRAGILAISAPGDGRSTGFRLFREANGANQNIGLNFGIGSTEIWMNPFVTITGTEDWTHIAITISEAKATIYVNGAEVAATDIASPIDWTGCTSMTIASGAPNFTYWEHFSDLSLYDDLHIVKRALTAQEVTQLYTAK